MDASVAGFPRGWKQMLRGWKDILRDFRGNVAVFDFYGASASTKWIHCPFLSSAKRWVLNYNDNANWNIGFGQC